MLEVLLIGLGIIAGIVLGGAVVFHVLSSALPTRLF